LARANLKATVLQQTFLNLGDTLYGNLDRSTPAAPTHAVRCLNQALVEQAGSSDVQVLDLDRLVDRFGLDYWYDNTRWLQAKIEISPRAAGEYADQVSRVVAAHKGMSRKCLVLDLDNTLWGGVVGDDGIENIVLGQGSAEGEAFLQFQSYAKRLKERGIILAVCSKNERTTAESVFLKHPEMVLRLDDISVFVANWQDKATNIADIAEQLNIGLDSLVVVDDNPAERALIRQSFPVVAVPELPPDPSQYVDCLSNAGYFEAVTITMDDLARSQQYAQNEQRQALAQSSQSIDEYLRSLEMQMASSQFVDVDLPRIAQLINKTNQFNVTTHRKTQAEVSDLASREENFTLQVRLSDRFGDNGLVSALILVPDQIVSGALEMETGIMSCRVFGRQREYEILNALVELLSHSQYTILTAHYIPTSKNSLIQNLYADLGFSQLSDSKDLKAGETRWILELEDYSPHSTHIERVDTT
jgi:FkbH-like protein